MSGGRGLKRGSPVRVEAPAAEAGASRLFAGVPPEGNRWFVVHTHSRQEKSLGRSLEAQGVRYFLPLVRAVRYYAHRRRVTQRPLFPSYLFLWGSLDETYAAVGTKRVVRVLPVPDQDRMDRELYSIRLALLGEAVLDPYPFLAIGRRARVVAGPMRGVEGIILSRPAETRLILSVHTLGQAVSTEIDPSLLEALD